MAPPAGWIIAALVALLYVWVSCRLPSVRENLFRLSWLKALALGMALVSGILEEYVFRGVLMDWLQGLGWATFIQVLVSALASGLPHGLWATFRGSLAGGIGAAVATSILGGMLAGVYLVSSRSLGPCIAAHVVINALAEPGLVLAALRGEIGGRKKLAM